jgi:N,N'-diacetyllegionaminate synthase
MNKNIVINGKVIGNGQRPYIIAEMACAHDGIKEKAKKLIDIAAYSGADAVQLQFFVPDETVTPQHPVYEILQKIAFTPDKWADIFNYARTKNIHVFVCTFDLPSVELAIKLKADGIKLNSADLSNPEVVAAVAKSGIPFTLGTGASTIDEVTNGLKFASQNGAQNIILMHGVQNFPTKTEDLHIQRINLLKEVFDLPVGYHDHTDGDDPFVKMVDLIAIGMGVAIIEKHITVDRGEKGIDYQASLEPDEFKQFVKDIHRAYIALGEKDASVFTESNLRYRKFQKKSIVASRLIQIGERITREDVKFIRNVEPGLAPVEFDLVNGKTAKSNIAAFQNILADHVE